MRPIYNYREKIDTLNGNRNTLKLNIKTKVKPSNEKAQFNDTSKGFTNINLKAKYARNDIDKNIRQTDNLFNSKKINLIEKNDNKINFLYQYLEIFMSGLLVYLLYRNLFDLCIKHMLYFIATEYLNLEYLFISFVSLFQIGLTLISLFYIYNYDVKKTEIYACITLASQLVALILFGFTQFFHNMTIWDHKFRLNILFSCELAKFLVELFFVCLLLTYKLFKYFKFINFKFKL
jgi:hypothetical protein